MTGRAPPLIPRPRGADPINHTYASLAALIDYARLQNLTGSWYFRVDFSNGNVRDIAIDPKRPQPQSE